MILEGAMIVIASLALTIVHPGIGFGRVAWAEDDWHFRSRKGVVAEKHSGKGEGEVLNGAEGLDIEEERDMGIRKLGA